jgi:hypothetical protein
MRDGERRKPGEIHSMHFQTFVGEAQCTQAGFCFRQFDGVLIQGDELAAGLDGGEEFAGVSAVAERAIDRCLAGLDAQHFKDLAHHDGAMGAGGRFAGGEHFGERGGILRGIEFLVFLVELPWVLAAVARPARRSRWRGFRLWHSGVSGFYLPGSTRSIEPPRVYGFVSADLRNSSICFVNSAALALASSSGRPLFMPGRR